ncbi:MAG: cell wall-binding repeat-containing protein, partial [Clostridiaceae bacterium]|nr:cell wall-binding repeat-containing protein [Clostridiaceae bacterium]
LVELGGANRYETNVAVAQKLVDLGVDPSSVIMVGGEGFSDALSVAPVAAAKGQILLLGMNNADYMKPVLDFVTKNKSKVTVVGTKNVISEDILKTVNGTRVDGGKDRWDTNQKVLSNFKDTVKMDKLYVASAAYNAQDNGYADALVASALAGKYAAPLVLVDKDGNEGTTNALNYIKNNANKSTDLQVVGGTGVVSDALLNKVTEAVTGVNPGPGNATVASIEALSLNQFKVTFNTAVNKDSAKDVTNYKIDGVELKANEAKVVVSDDKTSAVVTILNPLNQYKDYTVSVKKAILTKDKTTTLEAFEQKVTFSDTTVPTLKSVTVQGSNKITVEFSEAVNMKGGNNTAEAVEDLANYIKINGQSISNYGLNKNLSEVKDYVSTDTTTTSAAVVWASKVEFYFDSALPTGKNTLKVSDGKVESTQSTGILSNAAKFLFKETSMDFNVDAVSTKPVVKNVTSDPDGTVYINFDRPMDKKTALDPKNYQFNNVELNTLINASAGVDMCFNENDTQVEIDNLGKTVKFGTNVVYVKNTVKDAYGNKVADDTRPSFTQAKDETKPTVTNVSVVDSSTIRVKFSKDVDGNFARNITNYKLKDAAGTDVTKHIKQIKNSDGKTTGNSDTFDIKLWSNLTEARTATGTTGSLADAGRHADYIAMSGDATADWRLTDSKYSLTMKNIVDTTSNENTMDEYVATISGVTTVAPKVTSIVNKKDDANKVVVFFSTAMDNSSLQNVANYRFKNGSGDIKELPNNTKFTVAGDNKSVTIELPTSYVVKTSNGITGNDNDVIEFTVAGVKDPAGNSLDGIAFTSAIGDYSSVTNKAVFKDNSVKVYNDSDGYDSDVKVDVQFDKSIDTIKLNDFAMVGSYIKADGTKSSTIQVQPDSISRSGNVITFVFSGTRSSAVNTQDVFANGNATAISNARLVKLLGTTAQFKVVNPSPNTLDIAGTPIMGNYGQQVYDFNAAPKTMSDCWYATTESGITYDDGVTPVGGVSGVVYITFDTALDSNSGLKTTDFLFTGVNGSTLEADKVEIKGNTVKFCFRDASEMPSFTNVGGKIKARAKKDISIRTVKDLDGNNASFVPSDDSSNSDLKDRDVTVK